MDIKLSLTDTQLKALTSSMNDIIISLTDVQVEAFMKQLELSGSPVDIVIIQQITDRIIKLINLQVLQPAVNSMINSSVTSTVSAIQGLSDVDKNDFQIQLDTLIASKKPKV